MVSIKAKVICADGTRVLLSLVCATRRVADEVIERSYPDHIAALLIVQRTGKGAPC